MHFGSSNILESISTPETSGKKFAIGIFKNHQGGFMILDFFQQTETQKLTTQLSQYGLNPSEWTLHQEDSGLYAIQSKQDQNFTFAGKTKKQGSAIKWEKIELLSI